MHLEKPTPWQLIIKSNAQVRWVIGGILGLFFFLLLVYLWLVEDFVISQESIFVSVLLLLFSCFFWLEVRFPATITTFDKNGGTFTVEKKWIGLRRTVTIPLASIKTIHVTSRGRFGKDRFYFKMKVEMLSGELLPINSQYHRRPDGHVKTIAKELREFLKPDFSVGSNWVD